MKTDRITVNKTGETPDGVEIEIIVPENELESGVLAYLLTTFMRDAQRAGRTVCQLPVDLTVDHQREGSFVVMGAKGGHNDGMYDLPRPLAVAGIRRVIDRFEVIHAPVQDAQPNASESPDVAGGSVDASGVATESK